MSSYCSHRNHCVHAYQQSDQTLSASVHNNVRIEQDSTRLEVCISQYNVDVVVSVDNNNYHVNNIYSNILLVCALFAIKKVEPTI